MSLSAKKFNLVEDVPFIHNTKELQFWLKPMYVIEDMLEDIKLYREEMAKIRNLLRACYPIYECRTYPVRFKFRSNDKEELTCELRHFLLHLFLFGPFHLLSGMNILDKSFMLDCYNDIPKINDYINYKLIEVLRDYGIKSVKINENISEVLYNFRTIALDFSNIMGLHFNILTFINMYKKYPRIKEIMETKFEHGLQPYEIEDELSKLQNEEMTIYKNDPNNPLGIILKAQSGMKEKQFTEFTISQGFKPTIDGKTINEPIENSTLIGGLDRPSYLYIAATGARKSAVANKKTMGKAGHFGKTMGLLGRSLGMSTDVLDCGTKILMTYDVKSTKHLKKLNGKFYKTDLMDEDYKVIDSRKDINLIGKTIYVRSVATCCLDGDYVCPRCFGTIANVNFDIAEGIGCFESEEQSKVLEQNILSQKHLLTTISEVIEFTDPFNNFFVLIGGSEINPNVNDNQYVPNITDYAIYIDPNDMVMSDDDEIDINDGGCIGNGKIYIRNMKDPDAEDILVYPKEDKEVFITPAAMEIMDKHKGIIPFSELDDDFKLFEMEIVNKELTKPLYELMGLLNKNRPADSPYNDINAMGQKLLDILIEAKIDAHVIGTEILLNRLIRSVENPLYRPDFTVDSWDDVEPYNIVTMNYALENNKSPLLGLSFQYIKRQLMSDELFDERDEPSYIDPLYWEDIPTDTLKRPYTDEE